MTTKSKKPFTENPVTKITLLIRRDDGSEAKIVARADYGIDFVHRHTSLDVFRRSSSEEQWHLCSDKPHPDWKSMSVDEYKARGRSEVFQTVTQGEILRATQWLGRDVKDLPAEISVA
ncbi:hypothetical protein EFK68_03665 [Pseudomonas aeruginosa]|uniref:hypothetical protein n=1 Tax=Pseudomonas aeruginosa TaxID=287 RepID=UPI000F6AEC35|nr:hypothetical protein [Pseudomonas aeruginosa]EKF7416873.1 hypothetical protein [Pseudomonas aeruginosa]MDS9918423.1 hypothetical protein [Pseudomonas aeruginosa]RNF58485.1 hypothetical protein EFK68_03665 [Pseudomonas aeruginosa]HCA5866504.1 hypothetical protein [Pseudomonas aeruginosa]HCA7376621.1 hypothetical protein [Pseudomonas aeruginosa]